MKKWIMIASLLASSMAGSTHAQTRLDTDIVDTAVKAGNFQTLATALTAANLAQTLKGPGPFTVFAPSDQAFGKLPAGTVEGLLKDIPALTNILTYHVVAGEKLPSDLLGRKKTATLQGKEVDVRKCGNTLYVNDATVEAVIQVKNGIIYVIDSVLLP